ncbi:MAG TPA: hypothetical protein VI457_05850 [Methylococcaceae bacterium]|nr:hypothetical protein [Methylococcaceae bacterium]
MEHPDLGESFEVGCVCAEKMSDDYEGPQRREAKLRNRAVRRTRWLQRKWRVIGGMLHPSGNCTYRINYLIGDRSAPVPHATNPVPYDQGRRAFRERFVHRLIEGRVSRCGRGFNSVNGNRTGVLSDVLG